MQHILVFFEKTVERYPDKVAVACGDHTYTYRELKEGALRMAAVIRRLDSRTRQPIPVLVERDIPTLMHFLSVLYSGNFYIPMDPEMPPMKKASILEESNPSLLICPAEMKGMVEKLGYPGHILTDEDIPADQAPALEETVDYREEDPAYMVYTSGSTGKPKGVLKNHRAVCSFVEAYVETFGLNDQDIIGNQTPFFFDASAKDLYQLLYTGARMEILPSELFVLPPKLIQYLNDRKINFVCWVPTALAIVTQLNTFQLIVPETLKKVFFVGEVFPIKQLKKWMTALPELEYVNLYGSTELAGISCYCRLDTSQEPEYVPMGRPLSNCHVFLYDGEGKCVIHDKEKTGEVYVISPAMADEYYKDPKKTAEVFSEIEITEDMWEEGMPAVGSRARVLHTGDLARYDQNGDLVFASRKDFQIKHMGRRIELGEIEAIADQLPEIQRCCCLYDSEKKKIRLFCELIPGCPWKSRDVRSALKGHLTDYMLPGSVTILEKMPLNANGKIDRNSLKQL